MITEHISSTQLETLSYEFQKSILCSNERRTSLDEFTSEYTSNVVYDSLMKLNNFLNVSYHAGELELYTNITDRLSRGVNITPIEFSEFMKEFLYNPLSINKAILETQQTLLLSINTFYGNRFSKSTMGAFCELAPSIFGAYSDFFTSITNLSNNLSTIIGRIQNLNISTLLDNLKTKIISVVDAQLNKTKLSIQNVTFSSITNGNEIVINENILCKYRSIKDEALSFFNERSIETFKKRIEGMITYASSIFKNPTLEDIQFLVYRFCSFITRVEDVIDGVKNPLDLFSSNYKESYSILKNSSNYNTISAIAGGAVRYNDSVRREYARQNFANESSNGNSAPISVEEIDGVTDWNNGRGDDRIGFQGRWVSILGEEGWTRVDARVRVKLMRVQTSMGRRLLINSGYRSPAYNAAIRNRGGGAAKNSYHMKGMACDVTFSGFNRESGEEFISYAKQEGFFGIGRYYGDNFIHVDIGPERSWGG